MICNHIVNIPDKCNMFINDTDVQHPKSFTTHSRIGDIHVSLSVFPGSTDPDHITLSVFVNGNQHTIYSGPAADAPEFFSKFPKN